MRSLLRIVALLTAAIPTAPLFAQQSANDFSAIDAVMQKAVTDGMIPGGVVLIGHNGKVVYRRAFGSRSLEPTREAMTTDTIFDLASLTKCIATTTSIMRLIQDGKVRLNDTVASYIPEYAQNGKDQITVRELMTHYSGLRPDIDLKDPWQGRDAAYQMVMHEKPANPPGTRFVYSDINYETLGFVVEKVSGKPLNQFAKENVFAPLGMKDTGFLPDASLLPRIAPTQYENGDTGKMLRGVVHDPTARRMGGVAGHAGLFSTADDMAIYAQDLLTGFRVLAPLTVEKMSTPQQPANAAAQRGLGWDIDSPFASNRGELLPVGSYGHTGFTGTSLWIDPTTQTYIILLTNAVHPRGGHSVVSLRARVATAAVQALALTVPEKEKLRLARITGYNESLMASRHLTTRNGLVKTGIDVLEADNFSELHPNPDHPVRIGLITNQTAIDAQGHRTADVLAHAPGLKLTAIFSPEHGINGALDTEHISDSTDAATGAHIYSVYGTGKAARMPSAEALAQIDMLVYDIQDIGVHFYTYESTLGYFLEAAGTANKPIAVLDRPNPVTGAYVQGPIVDPGRESFVAYSNTPVRNGMTIGELGSMLNAERHLNAQLSVVKMQGWMRGDWFESTGLEWINPSPNMRSLTEATLYPGIGMIEGSNISVGRGTDTPFEVIGAPWIDALAFSQYMNAREILGVRFVPIHFTPTASNYANQRCGGVNIVVTERDSLDAPELGAEVAAALWKLYPNQYQLAKIDGLMVNKASLDALTAGQDPQRIAEDWQDAIAQFNLIRAKYLLY